MVLRKGITKIKCNKIKRKQEVIKMNLHDTVEMMNSEDYKERFKAEYYQLLLRLDALTGMLIKWENNMLDFEPKCSKETLENQVIFMQGYMGILRLRAEIEGIDLQFAIH